MAAHGAFLIWQVMEEAFEKAHKAVFEAIANSPGHFVRDGLPVIAILGIGSSTHLFAYCEWNCRRVVDGRVVDKRWFHLLGMR